jgi:shikimate 5-dehydrogenase
MDHDEGMEGRLRAMETAQAVQIAKNSRVDESLEDHEARLRRIEELAPLLKINQFILMGLGGSVIALIWALLTGQVQLVF